jgi:hypothetical protein
MLHASKHGKTDYLIGLHDYAYRHDTAYDDIKQIAEYVDGFNAPGSNVHNNKIPPPLAASSGEALGRKRTSSRGEVTSKHSLSGMREEDTHFGALAGWLDTPPLLFVFRRAEGVSDEQIQEMYAKHAYNVM